MRRWHGMVVTDLDGTLFQKERKASARNLETLRLLGDDGVLRVIATGRIMAGEGMRDCAREDPGGLQRRV